MASDELPPRTRRLFPASDPPLSLGRHSEYVIGRLLEDGEGEDLRWLLGRLGPDRIERLRAWLVRHGGRALSRRSRAFWSLVLEVSPSPPSSSTGALWPLA